VSGRVEFKNVSFNYHEFSKRVGGKTMLKQVNRYVWSAEYTRSGDEVETEEGECHFHDHRIYIIIITLIISSEEHFRDDFALKNVSFEIKPGMMCAIVGHSGAGKSTLLSLLMRLYDACEGSILIDGKDIRDIKLDSLPKIMSIVPQDTILFNDTIKNNILLARPSASDEELTSVCKVANIYDVIMSLPRGWDTIVGNEGYNLSGGEKQRITIARALLADPKILLLDEATSSLDSVNEQLIQDAMNPLLSKCTSLVIAHRLSTVLKADKILVLDKGAYVMVVS
jgi:ATP-binding cassette subfamily B protein